jgi:type I restriction enzyme R subunit
VSQPLERKHAVGFDKLLDEVAAGRRDDDTLSTLAGRLAALDRKIDAAARTSIAEKTGGLDPKALANRLLDAVDPDVIEHEVVARHGPAPAEKQREAVQSALKEAACQLFDDPALRSSSRT